MKRLLAALTIFGFFTCWVLIMKTEYGSWSSFGEAFLAMAALALAIMSILLLGRLLDWALKNLF